jgi:hypothetical protein
VFANSIPECEEETFLNKVGSVQEYKQAMEARTKAQHNCLINRIDFIIGEFVFEDKQ